MGRRRVSIRIRRKEKGAVSPAVAFAVLVLVLAATLVAFAVFEKDDTNGRPAPFPTGTPTEEDLSLTDEEAILVFESLELSALSALEEQDFALARRLYTANSPVRARALSDIRALVNSRTDVEVRSTTEHLTVTDVLPNQIELTQVVVIDARFSSRSGEDVTDRGGDERQTIEWTLRSIEGEWRIHDALVVASEQP